MKIFEYVRRHAKAFFVTVIALAISGIALSLRMPVSLFPDITFPRIVILADNGEEPAERMMVQVTKPLEEAATAVPGVKMVRSITSRGSTEISIGLDWGTNVQQTLLLLQGHIANIRNSLPPTAAVQAEQMSVSVFPIQGYSLTSDKLSLTELRDIALYQIRPALIRVQGVARIEVTGGDTREFLVTVSPEKLAAYHLNAQQVADAIGKTNIIGSSGLVDNNYQIYLSLVSGLFATTSDIEKVVVAVQNGVPIRVENVADVAPSVADKLIRTTARGRDAVLINIIKQPKGSTVQIARDVTAELATLNLPAGVHFENFYDQGGFINNSIMSVRDSILIGIGLSMIILLIFLRSWRITVVMMMVVPATIAATLVCLSAIGETINIMTLGGIAAAVGLIIDDAIVVIENIFSQFANKKFTDDQEKATFTGATVRSLHQMMPAIIGSTLSTIVIHIPLAFLGGVTGAFFASLSVTMVFAMIISFLFSITLAPLLASFMLRGKDISAETKKEFHEGGLAHRYAGVVRTLLRVRILVIPAAVIIMIATYFIYINVGSGFMPDMDEGTFVIDYKSPPGTSLNETNRMLMGVEDIIMEIPEVETYSRRTGTQLGFFITEPNSGDYLVKLKKDRKRHIDEVIEEVRGKIEETQPYLQVEFGQLMMDVIGDLTNNPSPIEIKLFGNDIKLLREKAEEITGVIETVPGVVDAFNGIVISGPSLIFTVDPLKASLAGFTVSDVRAELETLIRGQTESTIQKGEKLITIRVRYPNEYRNEIDRIEKIKLVNSAGIAIPLTSIATIEKTAGQAEIHRETLRELIPVTARISGRDLGSTVDEIKKKLASTVTLPRGVTIEFGGVYQTEQESFRGLLIVSIVAFMLVAIVLLFEFGDFAVPASIFIINILSLIGVFGALWITGVTFNISSFVGVIMVIGIVAENAIFVLHNVKTFQADGLSLDDALVKASTVRIRPILMTTLAAVLALLPLALGIGAGAQMQQPLAIAVIGGFSVSSFLLFFGLPVVYRLMKRE